MIKFFPFISLLNENNKNTVFLIRKTKSRNLEISVAIITNCRAERITSWRRTSRGKILRLLKSAEARKYFLENVRYLKEGGYNGQ